MSSPLYASLSALAEAHRECMALIARLAKLSGSSVEGVRSELATQIHESLKNSENELDLLQAQVDSESDPEARETLAGKCAKLGEDLRGARLAYRKAQLLAKRNAESERRREREALFGEVGSGRPSLRGRKGVDNQTQDDVVLSAASDVTASLRRTHAMLSQELQQSRFAQETLHASTAALRELSTRYSRVDELMMSSRRLITDLVRKNKSDSWYYEKAIYTLAGTLAWLIFRRWLYGPLWLFVWMPFKWVWWSVVILFSGGGGSSVGVQKPVVSPVKEPVHVPFEQSREEVEKERMPHIETVETIIEQANKLRYTPSPSPEPEEPESYEEEPEEIVLPTAGQRHKQEEVQEDDHIEQQEEPESEPEPVQPNPKKRMMEVSDEEMGIPEPAPEQEPETVQPNPRKRMMEVPGEEMGIPEPAAEQEPEVVQSNPRKRMMEAPEEGGHDEL